MRKISYFLAVFFVSSLIVLFYSTFFVEKSGTPDHASLTLTPFTAREQHDLITEQEREEHSEVSGTLIASMSAQDAQARVLNLEHPRVSDQ